MVTKSIFYPESVWRIYCNEFQYKNKNGSAIEERNLKDSPTCLECFFLQFSKYLTLPPLSPLFVQRHFVFLCCFKNTQDLRSLHLCRHQLILCFALQSEESEGDRKMQRRRRNSEMGEKENKLIHIKLETVSVCECFLRSVVFKWMSAPSTAFPLCRICQDLSGIWVREDKCIWCFITTEHRLFSPTVFMSYPLFSGLIQGWVCRRNIRSERVIDGWTLIGLLPALSNLIISSFCNCGTMSTHCIFTDVCKKT